MKKFLTLLCISSSICFVHEGKAGGLNSTCSKPQQEHLDEFNDVTRLAPIVRTPIATYLDDEKKTNDGISNVKNEVEEDAFDKLVIDPNLNFNSQIFDEKSTLLAPTVVEEDPFLASTNVDDQLKTLEVESFIDNSISYNASSLSERTLEEIDDILKLNPHWKDLRDKNILYEKLFNEAKEKKELKAAMERWNVNFLKQPDKYGPNQLLTSIKNLNNNPFLAKYPEFSEKYARKIIDRNKMVTKTQ